MSRDGKFLSIDGSYGEGGGQIVRTACALSAVTGTPCRILNIRKNRRNPGLRTQHLAGIGALARLCNARLEGDEIDSNEISFRPGKIEPSRLDARIPTAGSMTLVLQTLLPPSFFSPAPVEIRFFGGGTDTFFSPTIDYHRFVFSRVLARLGLRTETEVLGRGFYPKGGGRARVEVRPAVPESRDFVERGSLVGVTVISGASKSLEGAQVAERQADAAERLIGPALGVPVEKSIEYYDTLSAGSQINVIADFENTTLGADGLGERGKRAEVVGSEAADRLLRELDSGASLDARLADQILPYLALAEGSSTVSVSEVSLHAKTNMWIIEEFLGRSFEVEPRGSCMFVSIL